MRMDIVLATQNRDKSREMVEILSSTDLALRTLDDFQGAPEVIEDGTTLEENALKKARAVRDFTGLCALADDSGLEVDALGGSPGVFSSRYAGKNATYADNCRKLLEHLSSVPEDRRSARFRCVMALALSDEAAAVVGRCAKHLSLTSNAAVCEGRRIEALVTEGIVEGRITASMRGTGGFGYDPLFEIPHLRKTFAEMAVEAKNRLSHRYRALVEMRELLIRLSFARER